MTVDGDGGDGDGTATGDPSARPAAPGSAVRVLLVDDQLLMRQGLRKLLELEDTIEVVGEAADGVEALAAVPGTRPDVALVDVRMPRMGGVELIGRLRRDHPSVVAVVLATFDDDADILGALRAGAHGYLLKDTTPAALVAAVLEAHRGGTVLGGAAAARIVESLGAVADAGAATSRPRPDGTAAPYGPAADGPPPATAGRAPHEPRLTLREDEVAVLVASGASNREIAARLFIAEGTVKNHISAALAKLGLRDRTQLALHMTALHRTAPPED